MIAVQRRKKAPKQETPPLVNGDHLDQKTFHDRYEAMPPYVRAELIGGIVFMSSPLKRKHARSDVHLIQWISGYEDATPGTEALANATNILGSDSELQPDGCLFILPECGGQVWEDEKGYVNGAPEWVGEVSDSSESIDLGRKKHDYEKAGVREYMVAALRTKQLFWFVRRRGKFKDLAPDRTGSCAPRCFPGFGSMRRRS